MQVSVPPGDRHAVLQGLGEPEQIDGACKLNPTDLLSEIFRNDHDPKHVRIVVQVPREGEFTLSTEKLEFTIESAHQHLWTDFVRNLPTLRLADSMTSARNSCVSRRKVGPFLTVEDRPSVSRLLDRDQYMAKARKGESASKAAIPSNLVKAGRPRPENQERPHVSLYHDAFARFRAKIKDTSLEIPADVYADVT